MFDKFLLFLFLIISFSLHAEPGKPSAIGKWVSKGQQETRTLIVEENGKGQFFSDHKMGTCGAGLDVRTEGVFVRAHGLARNCQQKNNAVSFEFYCLHQDINRMRCKIRSKHEATGRLKEGVEDFERFQ